MRSKDMCGKMKYNNKIISIGDVVTAATPDGEVISAPWKGYARAETIKEVWVSRQPKKVRVKIDSYLEKNHWFKVGDKNWVVGIIADSPTKEGRGFYLVTRAATPFERKMSNHNRSPVLGYKPIYAGEQKVLAFSRV